MATTSEKIKVSTFAKDFDMKSKDILDILTAFGITGKLHSTVLDESELSLLFEVITQRNQTDLNAYFKYYDDKKKAKIAAAAAKAAESEQAQKQSRQSADSHQKQSNGQQRTDRPQKQPQQQNQNKNGNQQQSQRQPQQQNNQQGQKQQQVQKKRSRDEVRIVDTRGTASVDLSKYDDKLLNYETTPDRQATSAKQKIKKKNTDQQNAKNARDAAKQGKQQNRQNGKQQNQQAQKPKPVQLHITLPDEISVGELASRMKINAGELIKRLMKMGLMLSVNENVDYDTAYLICDEFGIKVEKEIVVTIEDKLFNEEPDAPETLKPRAPVVCVMGHVDHGKTSLLDAIRNAHVTAGEAGGITQHIGAYRVNIDGRPITFLDTPGHEAFTAMRARGANVTDIAVLVVAADDGIMPQTVEAINHAKAAGVTVIVAINKIDRPGADPDRVMTELTKYDLLPEAWGGDTICVKVSALKKQGIDELLEMILLSADMLELKANPDREAKGTIIEAKLDKGRGAVATVLVQNGTLHNGDIVIAGTSVGRVRTMTDDTGRKVQVAGPSTPVEIMGLAEVPEAGDVFNAVSDEKMARELAEKRRAEQKQKQFENGSRASLSDLFDQIGSGVKTLSIIVKADVQGSAEAVKSSLEKITNEEVKVSVIHTGVGAINEGDVMLAAASNAIIIGFNIRPDRQALEAATRSKVDIHTYRVIYECIDEVTAAMKGMLAPKFKEVILGRAQVRQCIRVPNVGTIAGCYILDGKIARNCQIRVIRDGVVITEDKISSLRRFKDDVREVQSGYECGVGLEKYTDIKENDEFEAFIMEEIAR